MFGSIDFGVKIGSFEGVDAYSNRNTSYYTNDKNYINKDGVKVFTGIKWQCVEYARRFIIEKFGVYFDDVNSAFQIYDKAHVLDVKKNKHKFVSYDNNNINPPQKYDVLIYRKSYSSPYGHVAIISNVNLSRGYVEICEQNYNNYWEDSSEYSRRFQLFCENEKYIITEEPYYSYTSDKLKIKRNSYRSNNTLGWKRIQFTK